ncbi:pyruvate dehydrogenase E1, beta subunit, partial [Serendipita sp. 407]
MASKTRLLNLTRLSRPRLSNSSIRRLPTPTPRLATATSFSLLSTRRWASSSSEQYTMTAREALNTAIEEEMLRDETVFVMGEEVAKYNGAYK